jgi:hypothetical protein
MRPSLLKNIYPDRWNQISKRIDGKYFLNTPIQKTIDLIEMKMDVPYDYFEDATKKYSLNIVERQLEPALNQIRTWSDEEVYNHIDLDKTPSAPWCYMGYKKRKDVVESNLWKENYQNVEFLKELLPIYKSCPKVEIANIADYQTKCRTFCVPGFHLLFYQLKFFGSLNEAMKNFWWSAYGFSPFSGGTADLYREVNVTDEDGQLMFPVRVAWDVSGYDRRIQLFNLTRLKLKYFIITNGTAHKEFVEWVCAAYDAHYIVLFNGDVVIIRCGNRSGSGTTTADNIIAGMQVVADILCYVYQMKHGHLPSATEVVRQLVKLYGDDNFMALSRDFDFILNEQLVKDRLFKAHNLILKEFQAGYEIPFHKLKFMGFSMVQTPNGILPAWDIERLLVPVIYSKERKTTDEIFLQRMYAILILSFAHPEWEMLRETYLHVLNHYSKSGQPGIKAMLRLGAPTREMLRHFYSGWESVGGGPKITMSFTDDLKISDFLYTSAGIRESTSRSGSDLPPGTCDCPICWPESNGSPWTQLKWDLPRASPDADTVARLIADVKKFEGSFNPYGNGQTSYTVNKPTFMHLTPLLVTCSSTCIFQTPVNIVGKGGSESEAWEDWLTQVNVYLGMWEPPPPLIKSLIPLLMKSTIDHPIIKEISKLSEPEAAIVFKSQFMEGSYNPYGNGQHMTFPQWKAKHSVRLRGKTPAQIKSEYQNYVRSVNKTATQIKGNQKVMNLAKGQPDREFTVPKATRKPDTMKSTGYEKRSEIKLSGCAKAYAGALICPFWWLDKSCESKVRSLKIPDIAPCIPMFPAVKTRKFFAIARGTFGATGTGYPYILFAPHRLGNSGVNDNVSPPVFSSNANNTAANSFPLMDTGALAPAENHAWLNTDYDPASIVNVTPRGVRFRVVAAGLRVKYTGNALNAAGIYTCVQHPNHLSLSQLAISEASKMDTYFTVNVTNSLTKGDGWVTLTYTPVDVDDFEFQSDPISNSLWSTDPIRNHFMGIIIPGAPVGGALFEYEAITHYEVVGVNVTGKTPTPADPIGTAVAVNSLGPAMQKEINTPTPAKELVKSGVSDLSSMITTTAKTVAKSMIPELAPILS